MTIYCYIFTTKLLIDNESLITKCIATICLYISRLVLVKHVFPTFFRNAKISISSYEILSCEILTLAFLEKVGNTCLIRPRRDIDDAFIFFKFIDFCTLMAAHECHISVWVEVIPLTCFCAIMIRVAIIDHFYRIFP